MRKQENYENTVGNKYQGSASVAFRDEAKSSWTGITQIPLSMYHGKIGNITVLLIYFLRIKCHSAAHTNYTHW